MLTIKDVAKDLQLDEETVARLLRSGKLKGIQIGNRWRVNETDLEKFKNKEQK